MNLKNAVKTCKVGDFDIPRSGSFHRQVKYELVQNPGPGLSNVGQHYPADNWLQKLIILHYPLGKDLFSGQCCQAFEQLGPGGQAMGIKKGSEI